MQPEETVKILPITSACSRRKSTASSNSVTRRGIERLATAHLGWADAIASSVKRQLPPSFDLADLEQVARVATWAAAKEYDGNRGAPFTAFAYKRVRGACFMSVRRRYYRDATHAPIPELLIACAGSRLNPGNDDDKRVMLRLLDTAPQPDEREHWARMNAITLDALGAVPRRQQAVLSMHYLAGVAMPLVARKLSLSVTLAYTLRREGLAYLKREMHRRNVGASDLEWQ
jgi:RNA polymerase sigma factor (sigma-70 family)